MSLVSFVSFLPSLRISEDALPLAGAPTTTGRVSLVSFVSFLRPSQHPRTASSLMFRPGKTPPTQWSIVLVGHPVWSCGRETSPVVRLYRLRCRYRPQRSSSPAWVTGQGKLTKLTKLTSPDDAGWTAGGASAQDRSSVFADSSRRNELDLYHRVPMIGGSHGHILVTHQTTQASIRAYVHPRTDVLMAHTYAPCNTT